jgi:hypothetical protein
MSPPEKKQKRNSATTISSTSSEVAAEITAASPRRSTREENRLPSTPVKGKLASRLAQVDSQTFFSTPNRDNMKVMATLSYVKDASTYFNSKGTNAASPATAAFLRSAQELEYWGSSNVFDHGSVLTSLAEEYVSTPSKTIAKQKKPSDTSNSPPNLHVVNATFGGELPSNSKTGRQRNSVYDSVEVISYSSFSHALFSVDGLGPNVKIQNTSLSENGFVVKKFECIHLVGKCKFRCRIFYPLEQFSSVKSSYQGPVATQTLHPHSCSKILEWRDHLLRDKKSTKGLHPCLKEAVASVTSDCSIHLLYKPDRVYQMVLEKFGDNLHQFFPDNCLAIVKNQIKEYWGRTRIRLLKEARLSTEQLRLQYVHDIARFRETHKLSLPNKYKPPQVYNLLSVSGSAAFAADALSHGTKTITNPSVKKGSQPDHEFFVLPLPSSAHPSLGHHVQFCENKDIGNTAQTHSICFSSINLLRQCYIALVVFKWQLMACIDSTHGGDASGGLLLSFGFVSNMKHGRGSEYRHTYTPVVMCRCLNENEETTVFMFCSLAFALERLFDIPLDVKGGLVSDAAISFSNAYKRFFPGRDIGQCFAHVATKFKDQRGIRKRGSPGYLKYLLQYNYLDMMHIDVLKMHHCPSLPMFIQFSKLCMEAWRSVNENKVVEVFEKSYLPPSEHDHHRWRFNEFSCVGNHPQSNSIERWHLSSKGSTEFEGYCKFGLCLNSMMNVQFPTLVHAVSKRCESLERKIRILDKASVAADSKLLRQTANLSERDWKQHLDGFLVNNVGFEGFSIDTKRILDWGKAMSGKSSITEPDRRTEMFEQGMSLVYIALRKFAHEDEAFWHCGCVQFWKKTSCPHSYYRHYGPVQLLLTSKQAPLKDIKTRYQVKSKTFYSPLLDIELDDTGKETEVKRN